ncbi:ABC-type transport auxiliary lipoprotein family protein [Rubrivivax sp. RP6-9]|uniref:ABC-type transport auxiliary lipoprotein family protein n=1 Tax=Rubrivivax sp. RP6-9 TaxID=3415750 RepID=UPI003CC595D7
MNRSVFPPGRRGVLLGAALLGAGCTGSLLPRPAVAPLRYTLGEPADGGGAAAAHAARRPGAAVLLVASPTAAPGHDSRRMVYLRQPQALQAYARAEWVDTPARLLAPLLVRALQNTGAFAAVLQAPSAAGAALRLDTELLLLQHEHTRTPSTLHLALRAVLIDTTTRQVLGTRGFDARVPAASDDAAGGVTAAATAVRQVLAALAAYVADLADVAGAAGGAASGTGATTRREP